MHSTSGRLAIEGMDELPTPLKFSGPASDPNAGLNKHVSFKNVSIFDNAEEHNHMFRRQLLLFGPDNGNNDDSCTWNNDGACDDGTPYCVDGTDCSDCNNCPSSAALTTVATTAATTTTINGDEDLSASCLSGPDKDAAKCECSRVIEACPGVEPEACVDNVENIRRLNTHAVIAMGSIALIAFVASVLVYRKIQREIPLKLIRAKEKARKLKLERQQKENEERRKNRELVHQQKEYAKKLERQKVLENDVAREQAIYNGKVRDLSANLKKRIKAAEGGVTLAQSALRASENDASQKKINYDMRVKMYNGWEAQQKRYNELEEEIKGYQIEGESAGRNRDSKAKDFEAKTKAVNDANVKLVAAVSKHQEQVARVQRRQDRYAVMQEAYKANAALKDDKATAASKLAGAKKSVDDAEAARDQDAAERQAQKEKYTRDLADCEILLDSEDKQEKKRAGKDQTKITAFLKKIQATETQLQGEVNKCQNKLDGYNAALASNITDAILAEDKRKMNGLKQQLDDAEADEDALRLDKNDAQKEVNRSKQEADKAKKGLAKLDGAKDKKGKKKEIGKAKKKQQKIRKENRSPKFTKVYGAQRTSIQWVNMEKGNWDRAIGRVEIQERNLKAAESKVQAERAKGQINNSLLLNYIKQLEALDKEIAIEKRNIKSVENAVTTRGKLRAQAAIDTKVGDLKVEMNNLDAMSTELAEDIAKSCTIVCTHGEGFANDGEGFGDEELEAVQKSTAAEIAAEGGGDDNDADLEDGSPVVVDHRRVEIDKCDLCDKYGYTNDQIKVGGNAKPKDSEDDSWKDQMKGGDFIVWKPERKASEVRVTVWDDKADKFGLVTLTIDDANGCLVNKDSVEPQIENRPKGFVAEKLSYALSVRAGGDWEIDHLAYFDYAPKLSSHDTQAQYHVKLKRQLFVSEKDEEKITKLTQEGRSNKSYIILFVFELFDWMSDWGFYAINTKQDTTLEACMNDEGNSFSSFKYDEYAQAVLFFNIVGSIAVFPIEIYMVYIRLTSSQEDAEELENWISTGMLISILLEDLPQLVLQAIYFGIAKKPMDFVNTGSICLTVAGLLLSLYMSKQFLVNFKNTYITKGKVKEELKGDFSKEMWKLGTIVLAISHIFDMVSTWCFFGKVVVQRNPNPDELQLNFNISLDGDITMYGESYTDYRGAYIAMCVLQTIFAPMRLALCVRGFNKQGREADKREAQGNDSADEAGASSGLVFAVLQTITTVLLDIPEACLVFVYFNCLGKSGDESEGFDSLAAFTLVFNVANIVATVLLCLPFIKIMLSSMLGFADILQFGLSDAKIEQYKQKSWQMTLGILTILSLASMSVDWMFCRNVYTSMDFERKWMSYPAEGDGSTFLSIGGYRKACAAICSFGTVYALWQGWRFTKSFLSLLPGATFGRKLELLTSKKARDQRREKLRLAKENDEFAVKEGDGDDEEFGGFDDESNESAEADEDAIQYEDEVDLQMAILAVVSIVLVHGPMMLLQSTYLQTLAGSRVGIDAVENPENYNCLLEYGPKGFAECASLILVESADFTAKEWELLGETDQGNFNFEVDEWKRQLAVATLGGTSIDTAAMMLTAIGLVVGFGFLYILLKELLNRKTGDEEMISPKDNPITFMLSWFPGFLVLMVQINCFISAWLFYFNGVKSQAVELFREELPINVEHESYRRAMLGFNLIGTIAAPLCLLFVGRKLMMSQRFNELETSRGNVQQAETRVNDANDDYEKQVNTGEEELISDANKAVENAKAELVRMQKQLKESQAMPWYIVAAFTGIMFAKTIPHIILAGTFVRQAALAESTNGISLYFFASLLVELLVELRCIASWMHTDHPTFLLVSACYSAALFTHWFSWGLEISVFGPTVASKLGLATQIIATAFVCPGICFFTRKHLLALIEARKAEARAKNLSEERKAAASAAYDEIEDSEKTGTGTKEIEDLYLAIGDADADEDADNAGQKAKPEAVAESFKHIATSLSTWEGLSALADNSFLAVLFGISFLVKSVPGIVVQGMYFYATGSTSTSGTATGFGLLFSTLCCFLELTVIFKWAKRKTNMFAYTLAVHCLNLLGMWLFVGLAVAQYGSKGILAGSAIFASVGSLVMAPIHLTLVWRHVEKAPEVKEEGIARMTVFGDITNNNIVMVFAVFFFLCTTPMVVLEAMFLRGADGRIGMAAFAMALNLLAAILTVWIPLRWLRRRHPMMPWVAAIQFVTLALMWLSYGTSFSAVDGRSGDAAGDGSSYDAGGSSGSGNGEADSKIFELGPAALAFTVLAMLIVPFQIYYTDKQLNQVTFLQNNQHAGVVDAEAHKTSKTKEKGNGKKKGAQKAEPNRQISAAASKEKRARRRKKQQANVGRCRALRVWLLSRRDSLEKGARSLLLDDKSGEEGSGARVVRTLLLDVLFKGLPVLVLHVLLFQISTADVGFAAIALAAVCFVLMTQLFLLGWWTHREHSTLLYFSAIEVAAWLANLALFAGDVGASRFDALMAFAVLGSAVLGVQVWIAHWQLTEGFMTWDLKYDFLCDGASIKRTGTRDELDKMSERYNLLKTEGTPPIVWLTLGVLPPLLKHIPMFAIVGSVGVNSVAAGVAIFLNSVSMLAALLVLWIRISEKKMAVKAGANRNRGRMGNRQAGSGPFTGHTSAFNAQAFQDTAPAGAQFDHNDNSDDGEIYDDLGDEGDGAVHHFGSHEDHEGDTDSIYANDADDGFNDGFDDDGGEGDNESIYANDDDVFNNDSSKNQAADEEFDGFGSDGDDDAAAPYDTSVAGQYVSVDGADDWA